MRRPSVAPRESKCEEWRKLSKFFPHCTKFAAQYKDTKKTLREIGQELDLDYVVSGKVRRFRGLIRISVELSNTREQTVTWANTYERDLEDIFETQEEIGNSIGRALSFEMLLPVHAGIIRTSPDAYSRYLFARFCLSKRTRESLQRARECFEQTVRTDAHYAPGFAGLAETHNIMANRWYAEPHTAYALASKAARTAIESGAELAEAYSALGFSTFGLDWDLPAANQHFRRAIELNPNSANARHYYGFCLIASGNSEAALEQLDAALDFNPLAYQTHAIRIFALFNARRYDEAIEQGHKAVSLNPSYAAAHGNLAMALAEAGHRREAIREADATLRVSGGDPLLTSGAAYTYAKVGQRDKALRIVSQLSKMREKTYIASEMISPIFAALGMKDEAFAWHQKAREARGDWFVFSMVDPRLDPLRSDRRWKDLIAPLIEKLNY